jgi:formiminoglutamase
VKTHTCWNIKIYRRPLSDSQIESLLTRYYRPFHEKLSHLAGDVTLGIDCHTMAAVGPPIGPGPGIERPRLCLSNADGTCPEEWLQGLARCCENAFGAAVSLNDPFKGGYIIRTHATELPWVQLELSRAPFMQNSEKRGCVLKALETWCSQFAG